MLALAFLGAFAQGLLWLSTVPFVLAVERDFGLSAAQVAFWVNIHLTLTVLFSIPIGMIVDRWGVKRLGRFGITLMSLGAMARGLANSYDSLLGASTAFGLGFIVFFICLPKALADWFPPQQMGMASGVFLTGYGSGSAVGLAVAQPLFGNNWRECFLVLGWVGILAGVAWWLLARDRATPSGQGNIAAGKGAVESFKQASSVRETWLLTIIFFCYAAAFSSWFTFGFPFLVRFRSLAEHAAGAVLNLTMVGYTIAAVAMPLLSDRLGRRKPFLFFFSFVAVLLFLGLVIWDQGTIIRLIAFLMGVCFGTVNPLVFTVAAESRKLGRTVMGASVGIISSLGSIAGFLIPVTHGTLLGALNAATESSFHTVWLLTGFWVSGILVCAFLLEETGSAAPESVQERV